ncbi:general secretion pathway protein GspK [Sphingomonas gilva]|uniref:Type II secretion system protein K n=1 Tax=Sphingomonas gilva TaxID=2305907 RepID=A0A396RRM6_9SPHN|nr:type II secretion system minor pseudopilin GspK [Sphingomonas gilva]RHW16963.1 general secretion pathway protein GspK [Sphingomonas gilva]
MTPPREEGAALLSVLLLVSVMSVLAATLLERVSLATSLAVNGAANAQARAYARAAEAIARVQIADLMARDASQTTLAGGWQGALRALPVPGGSGSAGVVDGGNCFNLNSVVSETPGATPADTLLVANPIALRQFVALATSLGVGPGDAARIAAGLADWIDSDSVPAPSGGEDAAYAGRDPAMLPANRFVLDVSELRVVPGMTPDIYARLKPFICALPVGGLSPVNVNTLTERQAPLLAMLFDGRLPVEAARSVIAERPVDGYGSQVRFWDHPVLRALEPDAAVRAQPQVRSRWFVVEVRLELAGAELRETALFDAEADPVKLVRRSWGEEG